MRAGIIVPPGPDFFPGRLIISFPGVVKGEVHEFGKRDSSPGTDALQDDFY
jgi:hypothetical protein